MCRACFKGGVLLVPDQSAYTLLPCAAGTEMRMLVKEVPFRISTHDDKTYTDDIGPLHEL